MAGNQPQSIGAYAPIQDFTSGIPPLAASDDALGLLRDIRNFTKDISDALCVPQSMQRVDINFSAGALQQLLIRLSNTYNAIIFNITTGQLDVYFGPNVTGSPDLTQRATNDVLYLPFAIRNENQIVIAANAQTSTVQGVIWIMQTNY